MDEYLFSLNAGQTYKHIAEERKNWLNVYFPNNDSILADDTLKEIMATRFCWIHQADGLSLESYSNLELAMNLTIIDIFCSRWDEKSLKQSKYGLSFYSIYIITCNWYEETTSSNMLLIA